MSKKDVENSVKDNEEEADVLAEEVEKEEDKSRDRWHSLRKLSLVELVENGRRRLLLGRHSRSRQRRQRQKQDKWGRRFRERSEGSLSFSDAETTDGVTEAGLEAQGEEEGAEAALGMTERQAEVIKRTWKVISARVGEELYYVGGKEGCNDDQDHVCTFFGTFYNVFDVFADPESFLKKFENLPSDTLRADPKLSKELQNHAAVRVIRVLEKLITRLDYPRKSHRYLLDLGSRHHSNGVSTHHFGVMGPLFVYAVRPYLAASANASTDASTNASASASSSSATSNAAWSAQEAEEAWLDFFQRIASAMSKAYALNVTQ